MTLDHNALFAAQDRVLIRLADVTPRLTDDDRRALYSLPPWRAVMLARIAVRVGSIDLRERDGIIGEAKAVGGDGALKPWDERTNPEKRRGVRGIDPPPGG